MADAINLKAGNLPKVSAFLNRYKHCTSEVCGGRLIITKRAIGDYWLDNAGKWRGLSSECETGPWDNRRAAEYAANDEFKAAAAANLRG